MEIIYLKEVTSTHKFLINKIKSRELKAPIAIVAKRQTDGVGSRGDRWEGLDGNLFLSFAQNRESLVSDLPDSALSIYFSFILKEILREFGSSIFLKWPNDFYIGDKKAGGTITKIIDRDTFVCSIGLNLKNAPSKFSTIDIDIDKILLVKSLFLKLKEDILWKDIFRKYQVEFEKTRSLTYYDERGGKKIPLEGAVLQIDGSIKHNGREVYSLR